MKVFVAGATGVLGRAAVPQLLAAGHDVFGLARTPEKLLRVKMAGAEPMRGDALDADAMRRIVTEIQPDAIVNFATAIPLKLRVNPRDWELNDRIRREGTANLLAAAQAVNLQLFVQESAAYVCRSQGDGWITEESPLTDHPFLRATIEMETAVRAASVPSVLLRFSALMAADSWHAQQSVTALRRGLLPIIGDGGAYVSLIHAQDAAQALVLALAQPQLAAGQIFNVTDDSPAPDARNSPACRAAAWRGKAALRPADDGKNDRRSRYGRSFYRVVPRRQPENQANARLCAALSDLS